MTEQTQTPFDTTHSADERTMAALAHGSALLNVITGGGGILAALIIWLIQKEKSKWVAFHALQALFFQAGVLITTVVVVGLVWVVGFIVSFATVGFGTIVAVPVMILFFFGGFLMIAVGTAFSLYAAYQVYQGRDFRYRWIGKWVQTRFTAK